MMRNITSTLLRGLVFLIPVALFVYLANYAIELAAKIVRPISDLFPDETFFGLATINVFAVILILAVCWFAGVLSKNSRIEARVSRLDLALVKNVPGYRPAKKALTGQIAQRSFEDNWKPCLVGSELEKRFIGFEVEKKNNGYSIVFQPLAPYTQFGSYWIVPSNIVRHIPVTPRELSEQIAEHGLDARLLE